jgi:hypothetical protein
MRELIVQDDRELRRLTQAITAFDAKPCGVRLRMQHLLSALLAARHEIEQSARRTRRPAVLAIGPEHRTRPSQYVWHANTSCLRVGGLGGAPSARSGDNSDGGARATGRLSFGCDDARAGGGIRPFVVSHGRSERVRGGRDRAVQRLSIRDDGAVLGRTGS